MKLPLTYLILVASLFFSASDGSAAIPPELPRVYMDTSIDPSYDRPADIEVNQGDDLQKALDQAKPGDIVELEAGAVFSGNFKIPKKTGDAWVYVRSSRYKDLPKPGKRISKDQSHLMPKVESPNSLPILFGLFGAHHFRFIGIEFRVHDDNFNLILLGYGVENPNDPVWKMRPANKINELQHHITFDRVYVHSTSDKHYSRTGISASGIHIAVIDSIIENCKDKGSDSQGIIAWNGPGPYRIVNNFIEGAGENIMFGGIDPRIPNVIPSDIEVRNNYLFKRLEWQKKPSPWTIKNLFELKNARRAYISGNIMENNWEDAQNGTAVLFTPRNDEGTAPWITIEDITFANNIIRNAWKGMLISGEDNIFQTHQQKRIWIENNLFRDVQSPIGGASHILITTPEEFLHDRPGSGRPVMDLTIRHNTFLHNGVGSNSIHIENSIKNAQNLVIEDNIFTHGEWGFNISNNNVINPIFRNNVISLNPQMKAYETYRKDFSKFYPRNLKEDTFADMGLEEINFPNLNWGPYRLKSGNRHKNAATDGDDIGVNYESMMVQVKCVITGDCDKLPPPPVNPPPPSQALKPTRKVYDMVFYPSRDGVLKIPCNNPIRIVSRHGYEIQSMDCNSAVGESLWYGRNAAGERVSAGVVIVLEPDKKERKIVIVK